MLQHKRLLLIAAAGAATTATAVLFMTETIPTSRLLYPVLVITTLAIIAGIGSARPTVPAAIRRSVLLSIAAFAAGMTAATIAFAVYTHFASLRVEDPRHRVAWPLFAVLFVGTILLAVAAFSAATAMTSAIARYRRSNSRHLRPDA
jgi:hypothetical protein